MLATHKLVRLYEANAVGLVDDELLDDVGWRLWERLRDVELVTNGKVRCPECGAEFQVRATDHPLDDPVPCPGCDWQVTPHAWHRSWEHRDLNGRCEEFERFVNQWPTACTSSQRMLLVDGVVHALHVSTRQGSLGNFAARNFLEGSKPKIAALLDELAYGPGSDVAVGARARWQAALDEYRLTRHVGRAKSRQQR